MGDKIFDSALQYRNVILDPPQGSIAVEAQDPPHLAGPMAVIQVLGRLLPAYSAPSALFFDKSKDRLLIDPITKAEKEVLPTPVLLGYVPFNDLVVTGLAISSEPGPGASISRKLSCRNVFSTADVIVVHVDGGPLATDGAQTALLPNHPVHFVRAYSVTTLQVVMPTSAIESLAGFPTPRVVARFAVDAAPVALSFVTGKVLKRLVGAAVWTAHSFIRLSPRCWSNLYKGEALLASFLYEAPYKILCVRLEDLVDFVQQLVYVLRAGLDLLLLCGSGLFVLAGLCFACLIACRAHVIPFLPNGAPACLTAHRAMLPVVCDMEPQATAGAASWDKRRQQTERSLQKTS